MTICSACRKPNNRHGQRYCRACHTDYMRKWRKAHPGNYRIKPRSTNVSRLTLADLADRHARPRT